MTEGTVVVLGAGPGLGGAIARRFATAGHPVAIAARGQAKLDPIVAGITGGGGRAVAIAADATREADVQALFDRAEAEFGPVRVAVYNASGRVRKPIAEIETAEVEDAWRRSCFGGFLLGREAARRMAPRGAGTILFTGASASVKGYALSATFAMGKFGLLGLAESMARELQPKGIHVAHFVIDGGIGENPEDAGLRPDAIAETYYQVHSQHRSAWSTKVELRPWVENF